MQQVAKLKYTYIDIHEHDCVHIIFLSYSRGYNVQLVHGMHDRIRATSCDSITFIHYVMY